MKATIWLWALLPMMISAAELKKPAVLFLPDQIECKSGGGTSLVGEIGFRWDENEPLYLSLWLNPVDGGKDQVFGAITVFDENGRELNKSIYVTLPLIPDDEIVVKKGDVKRFGLYEMYSTVIFPRPGNYYAVAQTSYGISGKRSVQFITNKRWFKVVEAPAKKSRL